MLSDVVVFAGTSSEHNEVATAVVSGSHESSLVDGEGSDEAGGGREGAGQMGRISG